MLATSQTEIGKFGEKPDLLIIHANELITLDRIYGVPRVGEQMSNLGIIQDGALAIKNDKIIYVGSTEELFSKLNSDEKIKIIDATGKIVTPGLIDPHTHIIFDGSRENELILKLKGKTYLEISESGGGILKTMRDTRNASLEKLVENGVKILDKMLAFGTTTIETKSGYGLNTDDEIKSLKVIKILNKEHSIDIVPTFLGAHEVPPEYKHNPDAYVDIIVSNMIPKIAEEKLAEFCDVFCEEGIFSIGQTKRILTTAMEYGMKIQIHIDEITDTNGAKLAADLKAVQAGHLLKSNDESLKEMAKTGVIATLLPGTPFCLMLNDYAPAKKIINYGIPVALATDLNPNCWTESMQMIITLACYNMKMSPAEALTASTLNAACALQRDNEIGSLEVGKKADIVIFNVPNHNFLPYHFGVNLVDIVIKNGEIVVQ